MRVLFHLIGKELLLLTRDWHALLLLFVMPAAFILVMSLALQNQFSARSNVHISYVLANHGTGQTTDEFIRRLAQVSGFDRVKAQVSPDKIRQRVRQGDIQFQVIIPKNFGQPGAKVKVFASPDINAAVYRLFQAGVGAAAGRAYLVSRQLLPANGLSEKAPQVIMQSVYGSGVAKKVPSSVQQSVPAWLLFAMFFIAIPLSTTWLHERQQGTYLRLRSLGVSSPMLLGGKLVPYLAINLLQVVVMLLVGVFVVPWCGGDALTLGQSWPALILMSVVASFAAVGYALLVANLVTTSEQATLFTGVANLLMAAVGGVMVPRFIMPHALQVVSAYSPMAWGLDGFLDVFLRGGGLMAVRTSALELFVFGLACLVLAGLCMQWRRSQ